jgi:hypothetical protein
MKRSGSLLLIIFILVCGSAVAQSTAITFQGKLTDATMAQPTAFTYQGKLTDGGVPANGTYDFQFTLYDAGNMSLGSAAGSLTVASGIFSASIDGASALFTSSNPARFLEIAVRLSGGGSYTTLAPRQEITSSPYSIKSLTAASSESLSVSCVSCVADSQISSISSGKITGVLGTSQGGTGASAQNFVDLTSTQSNIGGDKTFTGTVSGSVVNAATQYNIGGSRILGSFGTGNLFGGVTAGQSISTGTQNTFFGTGAGSATTGGGLNAFFGQRAGFANLGSLNAFFGQAAGLATTAASNNAFIGGGAGQFNTTGFQNSFFGSNTGSQNTTGSRNTTVGFSSNVGSPDLTYATAIGADATVFANNTIALGRNSGQDTVQIPGNLNVAGTFTGNINGSGITNLNAANITSGTLDNARLGIIPVANGGTGIGPGSPVANTFLRSDGAGWQASGILAEDVPSGSANYIQSNPAAQQAGTSLNIGGNATVGGLITADRLSVSGPASSGGIAANIITAQTQFNIGPGRVFSVGDDLTGVFVGRGAGGVSPGNLNTFVGRSAGLVTTANANGNSFFGYEAGRQNQTGGLNAFFGHQAGFNNVSGGRNAILGIGAGFNNNADNNTFVGSDAGAANSIGSNNTMIGNTANPTANNLTNATAIGANASVSQSNSVVLGSNANVGIGTSAPEQKLHVAGTEILSTGSGAGFKFRNRGSVSSTDDWVWYSDSNVARFFRPGIGDMLTFTTGGVMALNNLGAAGATTLCRNASNQISTCSSSARYKSNINPFSSGLSVIKQLRPVSFTWKVGGMHDMGLVAEDVAAVEPLLTTTNANGAIEGVKYDRVAVVLINAVQEQQRQIEQQRKQIESLTKIVCAMNSKADICQQ